MKRTGIITIIDNNNYGNRLQNYALQETLKKNGVFVETIKNDPLFNDNLNCKIIQKNINYIKYFKRSLDTKRKRMIMKKRWKCFKEFNKYIKITPKKFRFQTNYSKYDCLIVGSDQVWNPTFSRLSDFELINFNTNSKRVSYAASFGISEVPHQYEEKVKSGLKRFDNISVREDSGKNIIKEITGREDVEVLIDPTMLLTTEEWDKVVKPISGIQEGKKYILNYFLGELSLERRMEIDRVAKENNCEVINILDKKSPFYQTGPSEFLYLEKNAFLICTDSFHACVFAILYNRPFVVFNREDKNLSMNSRIETLINKFKLKDREFFYKITTSNIQHDYTETYDILRKERQKSNIFLKKALDIEA